MNAILLSAGLGTRLRPITNDIPKCLVQINGRPLLDYWLSLLCKQGIEKILINTHHHAKKVKNFIISSGWEKHVEITYEDKLLGTGGTVLKNRTFMENQACIVAHSDNLTCFNVGDFQLRHKNRPDNTEITMMTFDTDKPENCGIIEEDSGGIVKKMYEKISNPPSNRANGAVYIIEPSVIDYMETLDKDIIDISTDVLPHFMGKICTFYNDNYLRDIGTPDSLRKAEKEMSLKLQQNT